MGLIIRRRHQEIYVTHNSNILWLFLIPLNVAGGVILLKYCITIHRNDTKRSAVQCCLVLFSVVWCYLVLFSVVQGIINMSTLQNIW